tara:strand:+ start:141 stop:1106 length:966 start_codon:yes stop_codon:yes gene_type:complete
MNFDIDILEIAKQSVRDQIDSLSMLHTKIDERFVNCVKLISSGSGRLITIGLGKSGIIAQKIAATLNSTGTLSSFIHASDAQHGDLGGIGVDDIVLFISKSGSTHELCQLLPIIKSRGNKIISMTGNVNSFLAQESNNYLDTSVLKEACPNNLAPTSSTTVQLVMGDALAIVLLKLNNISSEDFANYHPGGLLGKQLLLTVGDIYDGLNKPTVNSNDCLETIIIEISSKRLGATIVKDSHKIIGIITDGDLRRMLESKIDINKVTATDLMTKNPKFIHKKTLALDAFSIMKKYSISQLIIVDKNEYIGMIHLHDILKQNII